jgi:hypothetical protein
MSVGSKNAHKFAAALLLSTSMSAVVPIQPVAAQTGDENFEAYSSSRYNYCDAKLLGALWGFDAYRGKIEIGYKILHGLESNLEALLGDSRTRDNTCTWEDTGLTPQDAHTLASVWQTNVQDARATAAEHYTWGTSGQVRNALGR